VIVLLFVTEHTVFHGLVREVCILV